MSIFGRLKTLLKSNVNDMITKAEDPQKILNQLVLDMQTQLVEAKKQVAQAIADERRLAKDLEKERTSAADWEKRAIQAVGAGRDDLAKEALSRKAQSDKIVQDYQTQLEAQSKATEQLRVSLNQLQSKIDEAQRKKNLLIARAKRAEAQKKIQATMQGFSDTSAFDSFDRMEAKVDQLEAESEAQALLAGELGDAKLISEIQQLGPGETSSDEYALLELKSKMGLLGDGAKPAIPLPLPEDGTNN